MDWFKKWFREPNISEQQDKETYTNKDLDTKVAYRYPQLPPNFEQQTVDQERLSDVRERLAMLRERTYSHRENQSENRLSGYEELKERRRRRRDYQGLYRSENIEPEKSEPKQKKPFRPTEVPSPVYGYRKRKREEQKEVVLTGLHTEETATTGTSALGALSLETLYKSNSELIFGEENRSINSEDVTVTIQTGADSAIQSKQNSVMNVVEEKPLISESSLKESETILPRYEREVDEKTDTSSSTMSIVENKEESIDEKRTETIKKSRGPIPFNVLMLKQDRERLRARERSQNQERNIEKEHLTDNPLITNVEQRRNVNENQFREEPHPVKVEDTRKMEGSSRAAKLHYQFPPSFLLSEPVKQQPDKEWIHRQIMILNETLENFHVGAKVVGVTNGPSVTRFEISPEPGVKVNKITNLADDLKLRLAARDIRIEAPIPGKHTVGIEVPNQRPRPVFLREITDQPIFQQAKSPLTIALGLDIAGKPVVTDLSKMPHGLIAGATGSGKSVCINSTIISLLYKASPEQVKLLLIDPKMVELAPYNDIPHLISPVITNAKAATAALKWAVEEMERRYEAFARAGARNIETYNRTQEAFPYIVIIIDELADLMMIAPQDVEEAIARIAQKARAAGIHLLVATQRPSVDVLTGLIKANIPTRIAFSVSSQVDSRTIIDAAGAERLLGRGDMLFLDNGTSKPVRLQGCYISDEEIDRVVDHVRKQGEPHYLFEQDDLIKKADIADEDELLLDACRFAVNQGTISTSSLQRHFRIGYNRAARLIDIMEDRGMITEAKGSKPRDVLITEEDLSQFEDII